MQSQLIRKLLLRCSTIVLTLASHLCLFWIIENLRNILIFLVHTQLCWLEPSTLRKIDRARFWNWVSCFVNVCVCVAGGKLVS